LRTIRFLSNFLENIGKSIFIQAFYRTCACQSTNVVRLLEQSSLTREINGLDQNALSRISNKASLALTARAP
jgi:hypothetical protein